jgi:hypothetical protein
LFCSNCGNAVSEQANFCTQCGNKLKSLSIAAESISNESEESIHEIELKEGCEKCDQPKRRIYIGLESTNRFVCLTHDVQPGICPDCKATLRTKTAQQCGNCKARWRETKPEPLESKHIESRGGSCPKCGRKEYTANRKGFGVKRAIVGGALLGPLGLLAGATGRKKIEVTCLQCSHRWYV